MGQKHTSPVNITKGKEKRGCTKWEGVIVGYPIHSVGYGVWDPVRGVVFNTRVPIFYKAVEPGWWRKEKVGLPAQDDKNRISLFAR